MEIFMRKHYLDNIRFLTIFFVVIFHVYFYYNNIGTEAMFAGLKPYEGAVSGTDGNEQTDGLKMGIWGEYSGCDRL